MVRIAAVGQEAISNNEKVLGDIKAKYDAQKVVPDESSDPSVDKKSESSAGYADGMKDAKAATKKEDTANALNASTASENWAANMNVDAPKKEPIIQQTVATNTPVEAPKPVAAKPEEPIKVDDAKEAAAAAVKPAETANKEAEKASA